MLYHPQIIHGLLYADALLTVELSDKDTRSFEASHTWQYNKVASWTEAGDVTTVWDTWIPQFFR